METSEKLMELLDEYYGDCRSEDHKKEVLDFIESNGIIGLSMISKEYLHGVR